MAEDLKNNGDSEPEGLGGLCLVSLPTWEVGHDGSTLRRNKAAVRQFGERPLHELFEDASEYQALVDRNFEGVPLRPFALLNERQGILIMELDEESVRIALVDVTHAQLLAQERAFSERLSAVCNLAAGVAYELSNPLTVLQGRLEFMELLTDLNEADLEKHLQIVKNHAERISDTVRNLQVFAHPALGTRDAVLLPEVLSEALDCLSSRVGRVEVVMQMAPRDLTTTGDSTLLKQVFTALILAVADDAGRVGRLVVAADGSEGIVSTTIAKEGKGRGRKEGAWEVVSETERGAGFGPALAATIVRAHGGQLKFSTLDSQLAYRVELPGSFSKAKPVGAQRIRVLFVDDDLELCDLAQDMIEAAGHSCTTAGSAEEGISVLQNQRADLVIADVRLPGMSGLVMQEVITKRWPELVGRVVLVTGLSMRPPHGVRLLQKPFTQGQLLSMLDDVLKV